MSDESSLPPHKPETVAELVAGMSPDIYGKLKTAVELGKWASGQPLTAAQLEHSMQLIIAYEARFLETTERTGVISASRNKSACKH